MTVRLPAIEVLEPRDLFAGWKFTDQEILQMDEPDSAVQVLGVDDFDGDGTIDLMVETNTAVLLLVADKKWEEFRTQELFQAADFAAEMIIDMDQDGDVDVYGSYSTGRHLCRFQTLSGRGRLHRWHLLEPRSPNGSVSIIQCRDYQRSPEHKRSL